MITQIVIVFCSIVLGWLLRETIITKEDRRDCIREDIKDRIIDAYYLEYGEEKFSEIADRVADEVTKALKK